MSKPKTLFYFTHFPEDGEPKTYGPYSTALRRDSAALGFFERLDPMREDRMYRTDAVMFDDGPQITMKDFK